MATPDEFTFYAIAEPLVALNIRVFPIKRGSKMPPWGMKFLKEATTDLGQIGRWHGQCRDYNVAMLADPVCFLEFDVKNGVEAMCEEMCEEIPNTRIQRSGSGGSHMIFLHSDRSRTIGNRSVNRGGHEWFSFRGMNKYLIGAGSLHPNGNRYALVNDVAPTPIPDWVLDFIVKHSTPEKGSRGRTGKKGKDFPKLDEDFDFDDFCEFFGIDGDQDGDYFVTEECPVAGHRHKGSVKTGFRYDGESLGWKCFAQGCKGATMTIKNVIAHLEGEKCERYPHRIWEYTELTDEDCAKWRTSLEELYAESNADLARGLEAAYNEKIDAMYIGREKALKEDDDFKFDQETWDLIKRTDWPKVSTDPAVWGVPERDITDTWLERFAADKSKAFSADTSLLAADLGAEAMFFMARTRQRFDFVEPPLRYLTSEEFDAIAG